MGKSLKKPSPDPPISFLATAGEIRPTGSTLCSMRSVAGVGHHLLSLMFWVTAQDPQAPRNEVQATQG